MNIIIILENFKEPIAGDRAIFPIFFRNSIEPFSQAKMRPLPYLLGIFFSLLFLLPSSTWAQFGVLDGYDLSEEGYTLLGVYSHESQRNDLARSLRNIYIDEPAVLQEIQQDWVFRKEGDRYACGYHYRFYLCKDGEALTSFSVNLECREIVCDSGWYVFDPMPLHAIKDRVKRPVREEFRFDSYEDYRATTTWWKPTIERPEWGKHFEQRGTIGTMVLMDPETRVFEVCNPVRADSQFCPASTFKVPNSLIQLEEGTVAHVDEVIPWDGQKRWVKAWNQDQTMRTALKYSALWFYQELARRAGKATMQKWLNKLHYGNEQIGGEVDQFWVDNSLKISARQQVWFLRRLYQEKLPFSDEVQEVVKEIMLADEEEGYRLYGKTGWSNLKPAIGWYVGWVESETGIRIFALNLNIRKEAHVRARKDIVYDVLREEGLIPKE